MLAAGASALASKAAVASARRNSGGKGEDDASGSRAPTTRRFVIEGSFRRRDSVTSISATQGCRARAQVRLTPTEKGDEQSGSKMSGRPPRQNRRAAVLFRRNQSGNRFFPHPGAAAACNLCRATAFSTCMERAGF